MRQIISTAVVAVVVGAVAGATMGAVAQSESAATTEQAISPAAVSNINAHRVDGKHAIGYTTKRARRAGKLVATNKQGELPSNIVQPFWGNIKNKPSGFADGVDDAGVTGLTVTIKAGTVQGVAANGTGTQQVNCPVGSVVIGGGMNGNDLVVEDSYPVDNGWFVRGTDVEGAGGSFHPSAMCLTVDPASAITTANKGKVGVASREK